MALIAKELQPAARNAFVVPVELSQIIKLITSGAQVWVACKYTDRKRYSTTAYCPETNVAFRAMTKYGVKVQMRRLIAQNPAAKLISDASQLPRTAVPA